MNKTYLYIRVSTDKQDYDRQLYVLNNAGYNEDNSHIITETYTGTSINGRKKLKALIETLQHGDTLVIESLSRLARSLKDLLTIVELLESKDVTLKSIKEEINLNSAMGKFFINIMGAVNQLERDIISERTSEKLQSMKAEGIELGRPKKYDHSEIYEYYTNNDVTYQDVSDKFGISKGAISNIMKKQRLELN